MNVCPLPFFFTLSLKGPFICFAIAISGTGEHCIKQLFPPFFLLLLLSYE